MSLLGQLISLLLWLFLVALLARLVIDWVFVFARSWEPHGVVVIVLEAVYTVTDPPLKDLRRVLPPLRIGSIAIDLAFLVLIIGVQVAISVVGRAF